MRAWQAIILAVIAALVGFGIGNHVAAIAALALVAVVLVGVIYRLFSVGDVRGERLVGDDIVAWGASFSQQITLTNQSWVPIPAIRVVDQTTLPDHPGGYVTNLNARRSVTWDVAVPCRQRGRYQIGPVEATMSDPLGLFPVTRRIGQTASILVLPRWVPLTRSGLKLDGFLPGEARGRRRGEAPPTVNGVRQYIAGDSVASIHWQASARNGQLMTKLFDPEVQTSLWLALDLDGDLAPEVEDLLVTAATSLAMYGLHQVNLRVGLIASGAVPIMLATERGKTQQYRLQEVLAEAHAGNNATLLTQVASLERRLGPGHAVVLLTAQPPTHWGAWVNLLAQQGVAVRIVSVTTETHDVTHWAVPTIHVPLAYGDPAQEAALVQCLEGRARAA
jgi:uncharacterized protein (DUF58 family)